MPKTSQELLDDLKLIIKKGLTPFVSEGISNAINKAAQLAFDSREASEIYTQDQIDEAIRKSLTPYSYTSYLPAASPYTTPSITLNTPTKLLIPTTIKSSNEWGVAEVSPGNFAVQYTGPTLQTFKIFMSTSMTTAVNNVVIDILMYKNGIAEPGVTISRKVGTGADVGALSVLGEFTANTNDYVEVFVIASLTSTITFSKTSIVITEKN